MAVSTPRVKLSALGPNYIRGPDIVYGWIEEELLYLVIWFLWRLLVTVNCCKAKRDDRRSISRVNKAPVVVSSFKLLALEYNYYSCSSLLGIIRYFSVVVE